eukprot:CAMPEP_0182449522 /NCGR_PEP_ID=MMETSP1172-20130603/35092_1 /TAXON_ID=708627 /ORGANISM="Timspurckia oligopyrenoides, Strain CCMP3278" /LENGTH=749 /DNA_ID=CAMNT_0024646839 /DNA_START=210 /DNA_END=2459 /DNA_ORIENTATION=-
MNTTSSGQLRNGSFPKMSGNVTLIQHGMIRNKKMQRYAVLQGSSFGYARGISGTFEREMTIKRARPGKHSGEVVIENTRNHQWTLSAAASEYTAWLDALLAAQNRELTRFYRVKESIGQGGYSTVMSCEDKINPKELFAVKVIEKKRFDMTHIDMFRREVEVHMSVTHRNIVRIVDVFETEEHMQIVQEYCRSDLFEMLSSETSFSEAQARTMMRDILEAVAYLHAQNIVHRDLKPENIFSIDKEWPTTLKVADFGLSRFFDQGVDKPLTSIVGTVFYMAPEVVNERPYGFQVDVWAVGVILYELLSGNRPFDGGKNEEMTIQSIKSDEVSFSGPQWRNISEDAKSLLSALLQKNPEKRICAAGALQHRWFDSVTSDVSLAKRLSAMNTHQYTGVQQLRYSNVSVKRTKGVVFCLRKCVVVIRAVHRLCIFHAESQKLFTSPRSSNQKGTKDRFAMPRLTSRKSSFRNDFQQSVSKPMRRTSQRFTALVEKNGLSRGSIERSRGNGDGESTEKTNEEFVEEAAALLDDEAIEAALEIPSNEKSIRRLGSKEIRHQGRHSASRTDIHAVSDKKPSKDMNARLNRDSSVNSTYARHNTKGMSRATSHLNRGYQRNDVQREFRSEVDSDFGDFGTDYSESVGDQSFTDERYSVPSVNERNLTAQESEDEEEPKVGFFARMRSRQSSSRPVFGTLSFRSMSANRSRTQSRGSSQALDKRNRKDPSEFLINVGTPRRQQMKAVATAAAAQKELI